MAAVTGISHEELRPDFYQPAAVDNSAPGIVSPAVGAHCSTVEQSKAEPSPVQQSRRSLA